MTLTGMMNMSKDKKIVNLKEFTFGKRGKRGKPKVNKNWFNLQVVVSWHEYHEASGEIEDKYLVYDEDDIYHSLTTKGRKEFTEKVFYVLGDQMGIDPYFSQELEDRLKELYDSHNEAERGK